MKLRRTKKVCQFLGPPCMLKCAAIIRKTHEKRTCEHGYRLSATELSRSQPPVSGTNYHVTSRHVCNVPASFQQSSEFSAFLFLILCRVWSRKVTCVIIKHFKRLCYLRILTLLRTFELCHVSTQSYTFTTCHGTFRVNQLYFSLI